MYRNDEGTVTVRELDAITWAAKNAGVSYGVFAMSLKPEQYKGVFESYCEEILRRKREEQAWLRSAPAAKSKPRYVGRYIEIGSRTMPQG